MDGLDDCRLRRLTVDRSRTSASGPAEQPSSLHESSRLRKCFIGVFLGALIGVLPGIGPLATIAMLLPITFNVAPVSALIMLAGIYYGAQYGGSTTGDSRKPAGRDLAALAVLQSRVFNAQPTMARKVLDGDITASVPTMLALVEAIGGREKAQALATELGVTSWNPVHDSSLFGLNASRAWNYALNKAAFWRHERWSVDARDGMDDIAVALAADAWSRTGRVSLDASALGLVKLRSGLMLVAQVPPQDTPRLPLESALKPAQQLDRTLCEIAERYGVSRRDWVMMEMEYSATAIDCAH